MGKINPIRTIITSVVPQQILYIAYLKDLTVGIPTAGICKVLQVIKRKGKKGGTVLIVRFLGETNTVEISWRDSRIFEIKKMELEDIQDYFAQVFDVKNYNNQPNLQQEPNHHET